MDAGVSVTTCSFEYIEGEANKSHKESKFDVTGGDLHTSGPSKAMATIHSDLVSNEQTVTDAEIAVKSGNDQITTENDAIPNIAQTIISTEAESGITSVFQESGGTVERPINQTTQDRVGCKDDDAKVVETSLNKTQPTLDSDSKLEGGKTSDSCIGNALGLQDTPIDTESSVNLQSRFLIQLPRCYLPTRYQKLPSLEGLQPTPRHVIKIKCTRKAGKIHREVIEYQQRTEQALPIRASKRQKTVLLEPATKSMRLEGKDIKEPKGFVAKPRADLRVSTTEDEATPIPSEYKHCPFQSDTTKVESRDAAPAASRDREMKKRKDLEERLSHIQALMGRFSAVATQNHKARTSDITAF